MFVWWLEFSFRQQIVRIIVRLWYPSMAVNENGSSEYPGLRVLVEPVWFRLKTPVTSDGYSPRYTATPIQPQAFKKVNICQAQEDTIFFIFFWTNRFQVPQGASVEKIFKELAAEDECQVIFNAKSLYFHWNYVNYKATP